MKRSPLQSKNNGDAEKNASLSSQEGKTKLQLSVINLVPFTKLFKSNAKESKTETY